MTKEHVKEVAEQLIGVYRESREALSNTPVDRARLRKLSNTKSNLLLSIWRMTANGQHLDEFFKDFPEAIKIVKAVQDRLSRVFEDDDM